MRTIVLLIITCILSFQLTGQNQIETDSVDLETLSSQAVELIILNFFKTNTDSSKNNHVFTVDSLLMFPTNVFQFAASEVNPLLKPGFQMDTFALCITEKIKPHVKYYKSMSLEDHINDSISIHSYSPLVPAKEDGQYILQRVIFFNYDESRVAALELFRFSLQHNRLLFSGRIDTAMITVMW